MNKLSVDTEAVSRLFSAWLKRPAIVEETDQGVLISVGSASALASWREINRAQYTQFDFEQLMQKKRMKLVFQLKKEKDNVKE